MDTILQANGDQPSPPFWSDESGLTFIERDEVITIGENLEGSMIARLARFGAVMRRFSEGPSMELMLYDNECEDLGYYYLCLSRLAMEERDVGAAIRYLGYSHQLAPNSTEVSPG